ncbi:hypothetical protein VTN00DRAFT_5395 [Thermoascus crustaceus]|uniref:uncharacterized protein n=1 Tax=Thermoascus crustaceus TaxID=5088 RepID=UPI00374489C2
MILPSPANKRKPGRPFMYIHRLTNSIPDQERKFGGDKTKSDIRQWTDPTKEFQHVNRYPRVHLYVR